MKLLLDTHALLWLLSNNPQLSGKARAAIVDEQNEKLVSLVSLWELAIKVGKGNIDVGQPLQDFLAQLESNPMIRLLTIKTNHLLRLSLLAREQHGDPFDRLIAAQALSESCTLVSKDWKLDDYGVTRLW